jgi:hypothetical protein
MNYPAFRLRLLALCPPELVVGTHISKTEGSPMSFGVHTNSDDNVTVIQFSSVFEQRKRAGSSLFQASNSSQQPSPTKRGRIHNIVVARPSTSSPCNLAELPDLGVVPS